MRSWPWSRLLAAVAGVLLGAAPARGDWLDGRPLGTFRLTYYHVAQETRGGDVAVYGRDCRQVLARTHKDFHDDLAMQGTGVLADGRLLNFEQRCTCASAGKAGLRSCYHVLARNEFPWGRGAYWNGRFLWLQPYRSVAVDPRVLPIGSVVYVPELAGFPLPDGSESNGCVRAEDTGSAIRGQHLDWFIGKAPETAWLRSYPPPRRVTVYADARRCVKAFP